MNLNCKFIVDSRNFANHFYVNLYDFVIFRSYLSFHYLLAIILYFIDLISIFSKYVYNRINLCNIFIHI